MKKNPIFMENLCSMNQKRKLKFNILSFRMVRELKIKVNNPQISMARVRSKQNQIKMLIKVIENEIEKRNKLFIMVTKRTVIHNRIEKQIESFILNHNLRKNNNQIQYLLQVWI